MSWWYLVVYFFLGYAASAYRLPFLIYEQLVAVPDMSHKVCKTINIYTLIHFFKLLLLVAAMGLTFFYIGFIFIPLERVASKETRRHVIGATTPNHFTGHEIDDEDDNKMGKWHVFARRRGSF